jgi:vacuolar-type H+-ATPase subunit H
MELIKKIKQAETQAKEIIEKARGNAVSLSETSANERNGKLEEAQAQRHKAIETAVAHAENTGQSEVEALSSKGAAKKQTLEDNARQKMDAAANKIVAAIK